MDSYEAKSKDSTTESSEKHAVGETKEVTSPLDFQKILETFEETNDIVEDEKMSRATDVLPPTVSPCKISQVCESEAKNVNASAEDLKAGTANVGEVKKVDNTQLIFEIHCNVKYDMVDSNNKDKEISTKDSAEKKVGKPTTWATWKTISKSQDCCSGNTEQAKKVDNIQTISKIPSKVKDDRVASSDKDKEILSKYSAEKNIRKPVTWATRKSISVSKDTSGITEEAKKVHNTQPISDIPSNVKDDRVVSSNEDKEISSKDSAEKNIRKSRTWATRKPIFVSKDSSSGITEEAKKVYNTQPNSEISSSVKDDRVHSNNKDKEISSKGSAEEIVGKSKMWATWKHSSLSKDSFSGNTEGAKNVVNKQSVSEISSNVKEDHVDKEISSKDSAGENTGKPTTWATWKPISVAKDSCPGNTEEVKKVDNTQPISKIPSNFKDYCIDSKNEDKEVLSTNIAEENVGKPKTWATLKPISVSKYSSSGNTDKAKKVGNTQPFSEIPSNVKEDRVASNNNYKEISSKDSAEINVGKPGKWTTRKPISASEGTSGITKEAKKVHNAQPISEIPSSVKDDRVDKDKEISSKDSAGENTGKRTTWATWKSISKSKDSCSGNTEVKRSDTLRISPKASAMKPVAETRESRSMQVGENVLNQPLSVIEDEERVSDETRQELLIDHGIEGIKDDMECGIATSDLLNPPEKKMSLEDLVQSFISDLNTPVKIDEKKHVVKITQLLCKSVQAIKVTDASEFEKEKKTSDIVEDTEEKTPNEIVSEKNNSEASDDTI